MMDRPSKGPRIGIFTYHFSDNFGALLQAYGLQRWLQRQGCEAAFVNYHPAYVEEGGGLRELLLTTGVKAKAKIIYLRLAALQRRLFGNRAQVEMFHRFQREVLGVTGPRLRGAEDVEALLDSEEGRFDMLVCGSDQIWAPSQQNGVDPIYFLHFKGGAQGARLVSYAPSFGRATLDQSYDSDVATYLKGIDGISVREKSGIAIIERLSGRVPACVPDPSILYGDFAELAERAEGVGEGHVFCYALRTGEGIREIANLVGQGVGGPVLSPYNIHRRWREIGTTIYPSPEEWVAYAAKAAFVVSNSFHGTVFAILFRRPFLTVGLPGKREGLNERSKNLLASLGLSDRFVMGNDTDSVRRRLAEPIDWPTVEDRLAAMRREGESFLLDQLARVRA